VKWFSQGVEKANKSEMLQHFFETMGGWYDFAEDGFGQPVEEAKWSMGDIKSNRAVQKELPGRALSILV